MLRAARATAWLAGLLLAAAVPAAAPQPARPLDRDQALAISQAAIGRAVGDHRLLRTDGTTVGLGSFRGKPLVVSLVFTSCAHICPTTTRHLLRAVAEAREALGHDSFRVITVGFDTRRDNPAMMADFQRRQGVNLPGWEFLAADAAVIEALTRELGFLYYPAGGGFDHLIQATVLDAEGTVYRQIYGIDFRIPLLVEPLKELVFDVRPEQTLYESLSNRIRLFCTVYDPATDSYRFRYSIFIGLTMGLVLGALALAALAREWRLSRRRTVPS
ncbi:MAG TPA: SCO family protein [Pseudomonadales bacterium]